MIYFYVETEPNINKKYIFPESTLAVYYARHLTGHANLLCLAIRFIRGISKATYFPFLATEVYNPDSFQHKIFTFVD